ncbi:MBL fold metallo-hydrolase [Flavimarina sp. Hel_I_48]|uniref:MBL fold metallo-hydrolase n=1 Tax=Flavimarina sp. Hel_I_48 TaxID=1392488 RepID=UPI0004DFC6F3|nr:MBL fold metallo-hydrolase [Flavimarina sp. Hel_I_48]
MIFILFVVLFSIFVIVFLMQPQFGKHPSGKHLLTIKQSIHYKNGSFENSSVTPALTEGVGYGTVLSELLFKKNPRKKPENRLPTIKTDLHQLDRDEDVLIWFGHSSYFMQINGKKILVDPVFSGSASPIPYSIQAFAGSDIYTENDIPEIDYLFISHDHWDHFDYKTLTALRPKIKKVICGLGVGAHLISWDFDKESIKECDWDQSLVLDDDFKIHTVPARHFSGRRFKRNGTVWTSFVLKTPAYTLFLGGDSGYDMHFKTAGEKYGPFDLAILENGQYDEKWKYIHMQPEEVLQAASDLRTTKLLPVHSGKFALANHAWDEPLKRITALAHVDSPKILTPKIGEKVDLKLADQHFEHWWTSVD